MRHLLARANGRRLAVIVNEFGELGIDRELLLGCGDAGDRRQVVQAVGDRLQQHFDRPWHQGEKRQTRLVVIGRKGLDRAAITAALGG